jgi:hypothetical protein
MTMSRLSSLSAIVAGVALLAACTDQAPAPTGLGLSVSHNGLPFTEGLASPAWQEKAAGLVSQAGFNAQTATRAYPLLGVAQYLGVQRAEAADGGTDVADVASGIGIGAGGRNRLELDRGAVAGASVIVLTYLFPNQAQVLEGMVAAQANAGPGGVHPAFARPWLGLELRYTARAFSSAAGYQRWDVVGVGAAASRDLGTPAVRAFASLLYFPMVSVSHQERPRFALGSDVGIALAPSKLPLAVTLSYRIERFSFPEAAARSEQFEALTLSLGLRRRLGGVGQ